MGSHRARRSAGAAAEAHDGPNFMRRSGTNSGARALAICAGLVAVSIPPPAEASRYDPEIAAALADTAPIWTVPKALVEAVISAESNWNPGAISKAGAKGLMQVMPSTASKVGIGSARLFEPGANILAGVRLLASLLAYYDGDLVDVLVAYNAGARPAAIAVPDNGETRGYVARVLAKFRYRLRRQSSDQ
jgi:soluble lytic murein transglycosylase-like protein